MTDGLPTWQLVLLLIATIAGINGVVWLIALRFVRSKAAAQLARYGPVDPGLAGGAPEATLDWAHYIGTTVDGGRYFAPGWWVRGAGRLELTADALVFRRVPGREPVVIVPRHAITGLDHRSRFAGRGHLRANITVVQWTHGGGRFETGWVLGRDEAARLAWEARIRS